MKLSEIAEYVVDDYPGFCMSQPLEILNGILLRQDLLTQLRFLIQ